MPTPRTGSLEWRDGKAFARVWVETPDGEKKRVRVDLHTKDPRTAKAKLATINRKVLAGEVVFDAGRDVAEEFKPFAESYIEQRKASGVAMAPDEHINLKRHVYEVVVDGVPFASMVLGDVKPRHIVAVLQAAIDKGLRKGTIDHIKRMLARIFRAAIAADILPLEASPVAVAVTPRIQRAKTVKKPRVILSDAEIEQFIASPASTDIEIKMMSLSARTAGGMRTSDVNRWDWEHVDTKRFEVCTIPREKMESGPQKLIIPAVLRPFLAAWWQEHGKPTSGPVFPVTKGARKSEFRKRRGVSYARRLRRELKKAGLTRPELFVETATTKPVDFHSFRRAFNTALAGAGINQQRAMALAHHSDAKTHLKYVMETPEMMTVPDVALPRISVGTSADEATAGYQPTSPTDEDPEFRAGNGARTRDPQLGKLDATVADAEILGESSEPPSSVRHSDAPRITASHRDEATGGYPSGSGPTPDPGGFVVVRGSPKEARIESHPVTGADGELIRSEAESFTQLMDESLALDGGAS